jgi:hypothetical protein
VLTSVSSWRRSWLSCRCISPIRLSSSAHVPAPSPLSVAVQVPANVTHSAMSIFGTDRLSSELHAAKKGRNSAAQPSVHASGTPPASRQSSSLTQQARSTSVMRAKHAGAGDCSSAAAAQLKHAARTLPASPRCSGIDTTYRWAR